MTAYIDALDKLGQDAKPRTIQGSYVRRDGQYVNTTVVTDQVAVNRLTGMALAIWDDLVALVEAAEEWQTSLLELTMIESDEIEHKEAITEAMARRLAGLHLALADLKAKVEERLE